MSTINCGFAKLRPGIRRRVRVRRRATPDVYAITFTVNKTADTNGSTVLVRVFSLNPLGTATGFAVSLNNPTIRKGKNPNAFSTQESDGNFSRSGVCRQAQKH